MHHYSTSIFKNKKPNYQKDDKNKGANQKKQNKNLQMVLKPKHIKLQKTHWYDINDDNYSL